MSKSAEKIKIKARKAASFEISALCSQVSLFLRSGVTLVEGLWLLEEDMGREPFKDIIHVVNGFVSDREDFSVALKKSGSFPDFFVKMVEIGETSGNLEEMLGRLARYYERKESVKQRIARSITFPVVLIIAMAVAEILLLARVMPVFEDILVSFGSTMPGFAKVLMNFGAAISQNGLAITVALLAAVLLVVLLKISPFGERLFDRINASLPLRGEIYRNTCAEHFSSAMSILLKSGVNMETALDLTKQIMGNNVMAEKIDTSIEEIKKGQSLPEALEKASIFPKLFVRMLSIGNKTGKMDSMMLSLADTYEKEVDSSIDKMVSLMEPVCVAVLSVIVAALLISVMLPLINIMLSIG